MPNVGTLNASMYLDTSPYIAGLNQAAGATRSFQQGVSTISFAGFNRGIFATTTLLYGLERIMSSMSKGMEEYSNILGRIGTVADLTAASVSALADSMASLSVYQGVSRTDIMQGMYTAAQAGFQSPAEMRAMASSGAILSRASGKEINVKKSVDLQSGLRQALGIGMNSVTSNRMNDILLKGRDVGRWELDQMAESIGKAATVWGNQYAGKQSGEETLRQLLTVMSTASLAGISPAMTATGTRRIVERTLQLNNTKRGDPLRAALRGVGFTGPNAIENALDQGGIKYLNTLSRITRGGESNELNKLGYQSRDLMVLTAAMRGGGEKLNQAYSDISYGGAAGTTERYGEKMRQTYDYQRDRLRSEWQITSQQFMQATIPLIGQFVNMLESFNKVAQALPDSVKSFTLMLGALVGLRLSLNFLGFRVGKTGVGASAMRGAASMAGNARMTGVASMLPMASGIMQQNVSSADAQVARLGRKQILAAGRPYSRYLTPQSSPVWQATNPLSDSVAPNSLAALGWLGTQPKYGAIEQNRMEALRNRYAPMTSGGIPTASSKYGPTLEQRIRWTAYKQGQSVNFDTGAYGSLSPTAQSYFGNRGQTQGSFSVREQNAFAARNRYYGSLAGTTSPIIANMRGQMGYSQGFKMMSGRDNIERVLGSITNGLSMFGAAIMRVLGPMALLTLAISAIGAFASGRHYVSSREEKVGGLTKMKGDGGGFTPILGPASLALKLMGSYSTDGTKDLATVRNDYAREHNYIPMDFKNMQPEDIPGYKPGMNKKWWLFKEVTKAIAGGTPLGLLVRSIFPGERPVGLEGYRRVNMKDVMNAARTEQLSESELTKFQKLGIDVNNVESGKRYLNDYAKELGNEPPKDWESLVKQTKDGLTTYGQMAADAFRFAAKKIEDAATKAAAEIENLSIKNRLTGYTANVGKYIGFVSGQETLMNLEGMQKTPFQPEKGSKWLAAYQKALGVYSGIYDTPHFKDKDIQAELAGIEDVAGKDATKGIEKPFKDVLGMNARLTGSDFFAKYGPQLGNAKLVSDEMIANAVGLDKKNMSPELTKSILGQIRGLDYTSWTQTFEPQKAPFSQALQYGTREGYNATLERKEDDPVVQILRSKLDAVISAIVAKERDDDQKQSDFAEALGKVISEAMKPLAENELKNQDLLVSKLDKAWSGTITDPIVSAINVLGAADELPRVQV